jgi:uncharacterized membrane protein
LISGPPIDMFWRQRKRLRVFVTNSLWIAPVFSMLGALVCARLTRNLNDVLSYQFLDFGIQGARAAIGIVAGSMLTFVVFFFSVLLLTVQIAGANLSPRIIMRPFQSRVLKAALSLFVFNFIYSLAVMGRLEERVPQLQVFLTLLLSVASTCMFLFVVEYLGKELRPAAVMTRVAREGLETIRSVYPLHWIGSSRQPAAAIPTNWDYKSVDHTGQAGVIVAFDSPGLIALAAAHRCLIELVPQVGDFVAKGALLFRVYGADESFDSRKARGAIEIGRERTMEQDPVFPFRVIVDIAEKALSPAINDPTTGVLAVDHIQSLLQEIGKRDLSTGVLCDQQGAQRLIHRTPNWDDFVFVAIAEIRQYGATSVQIVRRLRGMLEHLIRALPSDRAGLLEEQLELLHITVQRAFPELGDREHAEVADLQGLGGAVRQPSASGNRNSA